MEGKRERGGRECGKEEREGERVWKGRDRYRQICIERQSGEGKSRIEIERESGEEKRHTEIDR